MCDADVQRMGSMQGALTWILGGSHEKGHEQAPNSMKPPARVMHRIATPPLTLRGEPTAP